MKPREGEGVGEDVDPTMSVSSLGGPRPARCQVAVSHRVCLLMVLAFVCGCSSPARDPTWFSAQERKGQDPPSWLVLKAGTWAIASHTPETLDEIAVCPTVQDVRSLVATRSSQCRNMKPPDRAFLVKEVVQTGNDSDHFAVLLAGLGWAGADDISPAPPLGITLETDEQDTSSPFQNQLVSDPDGSDNSTEEALADRTRVVVTGLHPGHINYAEVNVVSGQHSGQRGYLYGFLSTAEGYDGEQFAGVQTNNFASKTASLPIVGRWEGADTTNLGRSSSGMNPDADLITTFGADHRVYLSSGVVSNWTWTGGGYQFKDRYNGIWRAELSTDGNTLSLHDPSNNIVAMHRIAEALSAEATPLALRPSPPSIVQSSPPKPAVAIEAASEAPTPSSETDVHSFHGFVCKANCVGHERGYEWAEEHGIDNPHTCYSGQRLSNPNNQSFSEGCEAYVDDSTGATPVPVDERYSSSSSDSDESN